MSGDDDAEIAALVGRAQQGDGDAFAAIVKRMQDRVLRTAHHLTGSWSDAEDVAQEAFLRAYRGLRGFDGRSRLATWLHRIVINCALNHLRSRQRAEARAAAFEETDTVDDPRARLDARELTAAVLEALAELAPPLRVTLVLATVEGMTYKDIAQALETPEGTIAWRVNHARELLRARLAPLLGAQGESDDVLRRTREALGAP